MYLWLRAFPIVVKHIPLRALCELWRDLKSLALQEFAIEHNTKLHRFHHTLLSFVLTHQHHRPVRRSTHNMFASSRLATAGARTGIRSFSSASQKAPSRIQSSINLSSRHPLPANGLILKSARSNFAPSTIRGAMQSRGIVAETITTAVVIHGKALGAGVACVGLAGMYLPKVSFVSREV